MTTYRYVKSSGVDPAALRDPDADTLLKALAERLIRRYSPAEAMERLKWEGLLDPDTQRADGLAGILDQIAELRSHLLRTYTLTRILEGLRLRIEEFSESAAQATPASGPTVPPSKPFTLDITDELRDLRAWSASGFPSDLAAHLEQIRSLQQTDPGIPPQVSEAIHGLEWTLSGLESLTGKTVPRSAEVLAEAVAALNALLELPEENRRLSVGAFLTRHADVFDVGKGLAEFIRSIQEKRSAVRLLLECLPPFLRRELHALTGCPKGFRAARTPLEALWSRLNRIHPLPRITPRAFEGSVGVGLEEAVSLAQRMQKLDLLEKNIRDARVQGRLSEINHSLVADVLGELAAQSLQRLQRLAEILIDSGYLRQEGHGFALTGRGLRRVGELLLREVLKPHRFSAPIHRSLQTRHTALEFTGASRRYRFGDPWNLDIPSTLLSSLRRTGRRPPPLSLDPRDLHVYEAEYGSGASTVLLIDTSSSMEEKLPAAKKVALGLNELIRNRFPGDRLRIVTFYTLARPVSEEELIRLEVMPYYEGFVPGTLPYPELKEMEHRGGPGFPGDFTNLQEGLHVSTELLSRDRAARKHIFLITDAEPTACRRNGIVHLEPEPTPWIRSQTLRQVRECTRRHIRITAFMLSEREESEAFVAGMVRENQGKAFFTASEDLAQCVMVEYVRKKQPDASTA